MKSLKNAAVVRVLYRALLRRGRLLDQYPLIKVFCNDPSLQSDHMPGSAGGGGGWGGGGGVGVRGAKWYSPSVSFAELVRLTFRKPFTHTDKTTVSAAVSHGWSVYRNWGAAYDYASTKIKLFDVYLEAHRNKEKNITTPTTTAAANTTVEPPVVIPQQHIEVGSLLIAHPRHDNENWRQSVILVLEHTPSGTIGVALNRIVDISEYYTEVSGELSSDTNLTGEQEDYTEDDYTESRSTYDNDDEDYSGDSEYSENTESEYDLAYSYDGNGVTLVVFGGINEGIDQSMVLAGNNKEQVMVLKNESSPQQNFEYFQNLEDTQSEDTHEEDLTEMSEDKRKYLKELCEQYGPFYCGGNHGGFVVLHTTKDHKESQLLSDGVYFCKEETPTVVTELLDKIKTTNNYRFFDGYSYWKPGELNVELEQGWWFVAKCPLKMLFQSPSNTKPTTATTSTSTSTSVGNESSVIESTPSSASSDTLSPSSNNSQASTLNSKTIDLTNHTDSDKLWSKLLLLMGGEFYHFAHINTEM